MSLSLDVNGDGSLRRLWSAAYKKRILEEVDAAPLGEKGAILRCEKVYSSTVARWRQQLVAGAAVDALPGGRRQPLLVAHEVQAVPQQMQQAARHASVRVISPGRSCRWRTGR